MDKYYERIGAVDRHCKRESGQWVGGRMKLGVRWLVLGRVLRLALVGAVGGGKGEVGFVKC